MKTENKTTIKAVFDSELRKVLEKIGLYEDLKNGVLKCSICGCKLTNENFGGFFKENGEIKAFCEKKECYFEVLRRKSSVKNKP